MRHSDKHQMTNTSNMGRLFYWQIFLAGKIVIRLAQTNLSSLVLKLYTYLLCLKSIQAAYSSAKKNVDVSR